MSRRPVDRGAMIVRLLVCLFALLALHSAGTGLAGGDAHAASRLIEVSGPSALNAASPEPQGALPGQVAAARNNYSIVSTAAQARALSFRRAVAGRLGRLAVYGALFIAIGAIGASLLVVPKLRQMNPETAHSYPVILDRMALTVGVVAGFLLVIAIVIRTLLQYSDTSELNPGITIGAFLAGTTVGQSLAFSTLMGGLLAAGSALARANPGVRVWRAIQVAAVVLFLYFWASSGHSAGVSDLLGLRSDILLIVHVLAAGLWLGTLSVIFVTVLPIALRDQGRVPMLRSTVRAFNGVAVSGAIILVVAGILHSTTHLSSPSDLLTTVYGKALMAKIAFSIPLLLAGVFSWRVAERRLDDMSGALRLRSVMRLELMLAVVVLVLTSVLVVVVV